MEPEEVNSVEAATSKLADCFFASALIWTGSGALLQTECTNFVWFAVKISHGNAKISIIPNEKWPATEVAMILQSIQFIHNTSWVCYHVIEYDNDDATFLPLPIACSTTPTSVYPIWSDLTFPVWPLASPSKLLPSRALTKRRLI